MMSRRLSLAVGLAWYGLVTAAILFLLQKALTGLLINRDERLTHDFIGAFLGAFFAFLFIALASVLRRYYERLREGLQAIVQLEYLLNETMNVCSENLHATKSLIENCTRSASNPSSFPLRRPTYTFFPIEKKLLPSLTNIDFANDLFSLNINLHRANIAMTTLRESYDSLFGDFKESRIAPATFARGLNLLADELTTFKLFQEYLDKEIFDHLVSVRVLGRKKPTLMSILEFLIKTHYPRHFKELSHAEAKMLKEEIGSIREKHKAEMNNLESKPNDEKT